MATLDGVKSNRDYGNLNVLRLLTPFILWLPPAMLSRLQNFANQGCMSHFCTSTLLKVYEAFHIPTRSTIYQSQVR